MDVDTRIELVRAGIAIATQVVMESGTLIFRLHHTVNRSIFTVYQEDIGIHAACRHIYRNDS